MSTALYQGVRAICEAPQPANLLGGTFCPPVVCRRLKPGDLQPFEWWDGVAGRWCRGDAVPAAILDKLPQAERDRYEAHRWRWLGMRAGEARPCP